MATTPLLVLAVWSRTWIGWWAALPVGLLLLWLWLNPRAFPPPRNTESWAAKGVMGERIWLQRKAVPIPPRHRVLPWVLGAVAGLGTVLLAYGLILLLPWPTLLGLVLVMGGKLWFVDRMVWLYEDMRGDPR